MMRSPFLRSRPGTYNTRTGTFVSLAFLIGCVLANVEKVIFRGPSYLPMPQEHPNLQDLHLDTISPTRSMLRTQLPAAFPDEELPKGKESWFLLESLKERQRYEVRVCWAAIVRLINY